MIVFYSEDIKDGSGVLDQEDSRHCAKVLRKKIGDQITVLDGTGGRHLSQIVAISRNEVSFDIESSETEAAVTYLPTIGISILKNTSRLEWFLEKATEIGVGSFFPLICDRTQKLKFRRDRSQSIVISAMKQSLRTYLPNVQSEEKYSKVISDIDIEQKFICHYNPDNPHLYDVLEVDRPSFILIGPEGDFSDVELDMAKKMGFKAVNISRSRLRTETAGIMACQIVAVKNRNAQ